MALLHLLPDELCARIARGQEGLITLAQALAAGLTHHQLRARVRSGRWERIAPGVFRLAGVPATRSQDEWCAHLWAGAKGALVLGTAARVWGFRKFEGDPVQIAVLRHGNHQQLPFIVHRFESDSLVHVATIDGLRATTIPKTVMDLLGRRDYRANWMLDRSLIDRWCTLGEYWFVHDDPDMRGHRGRALLRERLEQREVRPPTETLGEKKLWRLMRSTPRFPLPERQFWLALPGDERIRYDFVYADRKYAIEVDEYGSHGPQGAFGKDRWRDSDCALLGWFVQRIPEWDIDDQPGEVLASIRAHHRRLAG